MTLTSYLAQATDPVSALSTGNAQTILAVIVGVMAITLIKVIHYHVTEVKLLGKERDDERKGLLTKLETAEIERRQEAERLLREQKDILREVLVTTQSLGGNLEENTKAMERLIAMVEKLAGR